MCDAWGMFALVAVILFAVDFVLGLLGHSTGKVDLIALGLAFVALQMVWGAPFWRSRP